MLRVLLLTAALITPAAAQGPAVPPPPASAPAPRMLMEVNQPGDESAVRTLCDLARGSGSITLETANQVTSYCLNLVQRFKAAVPFEPGAKGVPMPPAPGK